MAEETNLPHNIQVLEAAGVRWEIRADTIPENQLATHLSRSCTYHVMRISGGQRKEVGTFEATAGQEPGLQCSTDFKFRLTKKGDLEVEENHTSTTWGPDEREKQHQETTTLWRWKGSKFVSLRS